MILGRLDYCLDCRTDSGAFAAWRAAVARFDAVDPGLGAMTPEAEQALREGLPLAEAWGRRVACPEQHPLPDNATLTLAEPQGAGNFDYELD